MNIIILPPTLEEILEQDKKDKEIEEKLNKIVDEAIDELFKPITDYINNKK